MTLLLGFLLGAALWTFGEYTIHRFAFHEARGSNYGSKEHLRHHARRDYTLWNNWPAWLGVLAVGYLLWPLVFDDLLGLSRGTALAIGTGWSVAYFHYEWLHMACHLWAPRTAYGRWVRRNHFHHHFGEPLRNHGVSSPVWDLVFGTHTPVERVVVPRKMAMRWLLDADGEVKAEHRADYELRGRSTVLDDDEVERAFRNEAPLAV